MQIYFSLQSTVIKKNSHSPARTSLFLRCSTFKPFVSKSSRTALYSSKSTSPWTFDISITHVLVNSCIANSRQKVDTFVFVINGLIKYFFIQKYSNDFFLNIIHFVRLFYGVEQIYELSKLSGKFHNVRKEACV